jgi:hypothetical protein
MPVAKVKRRFDAAQIRGGRRESLQHALPALLEVPRRGGRYGRASVEFKQGREALFLIQDKQISCQVAKRLLEDDRLKLKKFLGSIFKRDHTLHRIAVEPLPMAKKACNIGGQRDCYREPVGLLRWSSISARGSCRSLAHQIRTRRLARIGRCICRRER